MGNLTLFAVVVVPRRGYLKEHIISDIRTVNAKRKDARLNAALQSLLFKSLDGGEKASARTALSVTSELYRRGVWRDAKTVNAVAAACLGDDTAVVVAAIGFFLGKGGDGDDDKVSPRVRRGVVVWDCFCF